MLASSWSRHISPNHSLFRCWRGRYIWNTETRSRGNTRSNFARRRLRDTYSVLTKPNLKNKTKMFSCRRAWARCVFFSRWKTWKNLCWSVLWFKSILTKVRIMRMKVEYFLSLWYGWICGHNRSVGKVKLRTAALKTLISASFVNLTRGIEILSTKFIALGLMASIFSSHLTTTRSAGFLERG